MTRPIRVEKNLAYVPLTQGYEAVIDASDVDLVDGYNWRACVNRLRGSGKISTVYAVRAVNIAGHKTSLMMHRVIAGTPDGMETDHIDSNGLNNRRSNLRVVTKAQNQHNRRSTHNSKSGVKGVYWHEKNRRWTVVLTLSSVRHYFGHFQSLDDAIAVANKERIALHGKFGRPS